MFYALSKALLFVLQPAFWLVVLVIYALWTQRKRRRRKVIIASIIFYFILGNAVLYNTVVSQLEWPPTALDSQQAQYAVILGGYGEYNYLKGGLELNKAADRLVAALEIKSQGQADYIIVSSGVHPDELPKSTEAQLSKDILLAAGMDPSYILLEEKSWNTRDNAVYTAALIDSLGGDTRCLLVTSAFHMKRAMACFEKAGLEPVPYPVDYLSSGSVCRGLGCVLPSIQVLINWQVILKEKVGMVVYGMRGWV